MINWIEYSHPEKKNNPDFIRYIYFVGNIEVILFQNYYNSRWKGSLNNNPVNNTTYGFLIHRKIFYILEIIHLFINTPYTNTNAMIC